jgi:hypothetical protein
MKAQRESVVVRDFDAVLCWLRTLEHPCAPPVGVGEFDVRYASMAEVVVWYTPARDGHRPGEVAIPTTALAAAWRALAQRQVLDEADLALIGGGASVGRWLLAILALVPGVVAEGEPVCLRLREAAPRRRGGRQTEPPAATA